MLLIIVQTVFFASSEPMICCNEKAEPNPPRKMRRIPGLPFITDNAKLLNPANPRTETAINATPDNTSVKPDMIAAKPR